MMNQIKAIRRASVPLVMIETPDGAGCEQVIIKAMNGKADSIPTMRWDMVRGLRGSNKSGQNIADEINQGSDPAMVTANPVECLRAMDKLPENSVVIMFGAEKILLDASVRQAIWNLRDQFKTNSRTLFLLVPTGTKLSADIKDDIVAIEHQLPTEDQLREITKSLIADAGLPELTSAVLEKAVDATLGLSEFASEQVIAMSVTKNGLDTDSLWNRKRKAIEQTAGLNVWKGGEKFSDVGGCENVKGYFQKLIAGNRSPRCIVFIDEIEKAVGSSQDTSGVSQEMLGTLLRWMQDKQIAGSILLGHAGSGKSAISKAVGNEAGIPTIEFDLTAMKGSLVGESSARLRSAIATVDAIGQGKVLVIATCNSIGNLPPELRRRFNLGTFFFDLPTKEEQSSIWKIFLTKYNRVGEKLPECANWTGAEIRQCVDVADRLGITLIEAANYVVPIAKSASETIESLRKSSSGRYLSASQAGIYRYDSQAVATNGRRVVSE